MKIIDKLKRIIKKWVGSDSSSNEDVREPTLIEKRSTCPLCIGSLEKIDDSTNEAPTRKSRISRRDDI